MPFYTNLWSNACNYNKRKNVESNNDYNSDSYDELYEEQNTTSNFKEGFGLDDVTGGDSSGASGATGTSDSSGATGATGPIGASAPPAPPAGGSNILSGLFSGSTGTAAVFTSLGLPGLNNIIAPSGIPGVPGTETTATISKQDAALGSQIFIYVIHILVSIVLTYLWGVFGANALFLVTTSQDEKDYIFPTNAYQLPYCDEKDTSKCMFGYGFPYDLSPRMCNSNEQVLHLIEKEEKNINIVTAFKDGGSGDGVSDALFNYIFNAVYGGIGRGGRGATKMLLNLFSPSDSTTPKNKESWSTEMKFSPIRKALIFIVIPIVFVYALIPLMGLVSGIMGVIFGILNNHPFWGIFFSIIFGIFVFIGNGIWTSLQTVYFFGYYPCAIVEQKKKERYNDIFESIKPYLLNIFYCFIVYFAFLDLGSGIGGGVMFITLVAALTGFV